MNVQWLGETAGEAEAWAAYFKALDAKAQGAWQRLQLTFDVYKGVRAGFSLPVTDPPGEAKGSGGISPGLLDEMSELKGFVDLAARYTKDVLEGKRRMGWDGKERVIEKLPTDSGRVVVDASTGELNYVVDQGQPTGNVNALPALLWVGVVAVAAASMYFSIVKACSTAETVVEAFTQETIAIQHAKLVESGKATPEQAAKMTNAVYDGAVKAQLAKVEVEKAKQQPAEEWSGTIKFVAGAAVVIGVLYMVSRFLPASGAEPMLAKNPKGVNYPGTALSIKWSPVNQAWFVMWHDQVLRIFNKKDEAIEYVSELLGQA